MEQNEDVIDAVANVESEGSEESYESAEVPTVEDYKATVERLKKAEKKLVELKKAQKEAGAKESEELIESKLAERDFYRDNPDFKEYKDDIAQYVKKGLSYDEAGTIVKAKDPAFGNRKKAESASISGGEAGSSKTVYTAAELQKLSQAEYNAVKSAQLAGKVTFKR